jgi:hypothetical protein
MDNVQEENTLRFFLTLSLGPSFAEKLQKPRFHKHTLCLSQELGGHTEVNSC